MMNILLFLLSFFIVSCGQPVRSPLLGLLAAAVGFAFFWRSMLCLESRRSRFLLGLAWFSGVQMVQLSWMSATDYMGPLILVVYVGLCLGVGVQFGILSCLVRPALSCLEMLGLAGLWVIFEWSRLFFSAGFTWNPVGLSLSGSTASLQMASFWGIYGLSFWVVWVNLAALKALFFPRSVRVVGSFCALALLPYLGGGVYLHFMDKPAGSTLRALLVQTALLPERKDYDPNQAAAFVPLAVQWEKILESIELAWRTSEKPIDLIVLPEGTLSYGAYSYLYDLKTFEGIWEQYFGLEAIADLPPLKRPDARFEGSRWRISSAYWAQALATHYQTDLVIGLDDEKHNAAFIFHPEPQTPQRYEKRVLVPISEYVPLSGMKWMSDFIAERYGITQFFLPGKNSTLFQSKVPLAISICYEETYGTFAREGKKLGAKLLVNLTNDAWFPSSTLAQQHFDHGLLRSVENGVSALRACNTGVTGGIDRFGRVVGALAPSETHPSTLILDIPTESHSTLYTLWGNAAILWISGFFICVALYLRRRKLD